MEKSWFVGHRKGFWFVVNSIAFGGMHWEGHLLAALCHESVVVVRSVSLSAQQAGELTNLLFVFCKPKLPKTN